MIRPCDYATSVAAPQLLPKRVKLGRPRRHELGAVVELHRARHNCPGCPGGSGALFSPNPTRGYLRRKFQPFTVA
jgi:hypothetical protein